MIRDNDRKGYRRLAAAVLILAIEDAGSSRAEIRIPAEAFFEDRASVQHWLQQAGIDPDMALEQIGRIGVGGLAARYSDLPRRRRL